MWGRTTNFLLKLRLSSPRLGIYPTNEGYPYLRYPASIDWSAPFLNFDDPHDPAYLKTPSFPSVRLVIYKDLSSSDVINYLINGLPWGLNAIVFTSIGVGFLHEDQRSNSIRYYEIEVLCYWAINDLAKHQCFWNNSAWHNLDVRPRKKE